MNHDLTNGECDLLVRALRYYMSAEQLAIHDAWVKANVLRGARREKEMKHAEDVRQHAQTHINAASKLMDKLRPVFPQHAGIRHDGGSTPGTC